MPCGCMAAEAGLVFQFVFRCTTSSLHACVYFEHLFRSQKKERLDCVFGSEARFHKQRAALRHHPGLSDFSPWPAVSAWYYWTMWTAPGMGWASFVQLCFDIPWLCNLSGLPSFEVLKASSHKAINECPFKGVAGSLQLSYTLPNFRFWKRQNVSNNTHYTNFPHKSQSQNTQRIDMFQSVPQSNNKKSFHSDNIDSKWLNKYIRKLKPSLYATSEMLTFMISSTCLCSR